MANVTEIQEAFQLLIGAGLDYAPAAHEMPARAKAWTELLIDVPGSILVQAARDLAVSAEKFPSIPAIRRAAYQVEIHNKRSAVSSPWVDKATNTTVPGVYVGWQPWHLGMPVRKAFIPPAAAARIAELEQLERLLTDEEMAEIDSLRWLS